MLKEFILKKGLIKILSLLIMTTAIYGFAGCDDDSDSASEPSLVGKWSGTVGQTAIVITFTETEITETMNGEPAFAGSYEITGREVFTIKYTHALDENGDYVENTDSEEYGYEVTKSSLTLYEGADGDKLYTLEREE